MRSVLCSFIISMGICFTVGLLYATEIFDSIVRQPFNFTYFESNIISTCGLLGFSVTGDVGILVSRLSPMWLSVMGCVGSTLAFLLLWSTTKSVFFYSAHLWILCIYTFLAGHSFSFLYQTALHVNLRNTGKKHWGRLLGALHVPFGMSSLLFTLIATNFLQHDISLIFLIYAGLSGVVSFAGIFGLRKLKRTCDRTPLPSVDVQTLTTDAFEYAPSDTASNAGDTDDEREADDTRIFPNNTGYGEVSASLRRDRCSVESGGGRIPLGRVVVSFDFQSLLWIFTFGTGGLLAQLRNLELFLKAETSLETFSQWEISRCLIVFSVTTSLSRIGCGALSDLWVGRVPRINFLLVGVMCHALTCLFASVLVKEVVDVWVILCFTGGLSYGLLWVICPTILAERYGVRNFTFLWGILLLCSVLCSLLVQIGYIGIGNSFSSLEYRCDFNCVQLDVVVCTVLCGCALFLTCGHAIVS